MKRKRREGRALTHHHERGEREGRVEKGIQFCAEKTDNNNGDGKKFAQMWDKLRTGSVSEPVSRGEKVRVYRLPGRNRRER